MFLSFCKELIDAQHFIELCTIHFEVIEHNIQGGW